MHQASEYSGALFQVASQFNALEMTGSEVTPEHSVTRYERDHIQCPACAIALLADTAQSRMAQRLARRVLRKVPSSLLASARAEMMLTSLASN
jgi:hypothetical protein